MRSIEWALVSGAAIPFVAVASLGGCALVYNYGDYRGQGGGGTTSGTGGASGNGGSSPGCDPATSSTPVAASCGIFVSSSKGSDKHDGSQSTPVQTIQHALDIAKGRSIYVCGEDFSEVVVVPAGAEIFGALDCKNHWAYDGSKPTHLTAAADKIPLTLSPGAATTRVSDFDIESADATADGGSSIAVLANGVEAELTRCTIEAHAGAPGKAGTHEMPVVTPVKANGKGGDLGCTTSGPHSGGAGALNTCGSDMSAGGSGGNGGVVSGDTGQQGQPTGGMSPVDGGPGKGQDNTSCGTGHQGADGQPGEAGPGAIGIGQVLSSGYMGPAGSDGMTSGEIGHGGGGGGGAKACSGDNGPGGGGGGAGGCGGAPGGGGHAGGSSIGLVSLAATLTLTDCNITSTMAGTGGAGGDGQVGGNGGGQGDRGNPGACAGGPGGAGGRGGSGGGGLGGHSVGIAFKGGKPPKIAGGTISHSAGAEGGDGGDMDQGAAGVRGQGCKELDFDSGKCS